MQAAQQSTVCGGLAPDERAPAGPPGGQGQAVDFALHPTCGPQMGDWMACLRIAIHGQPTLYAAFIDGQPPKVILLRSAVRFDDVAMQMVYPDRSVASRRASL
jgi:hypothetical protein